MLDFDQAFARLVDHEGGYSDDPKDPGNWTGGREGVGELKGTKYGIAANTYGYLDIKNLTLEQAKGIYQRDFWDVLGTAHPALKFQFFDAAVNHGPGNAIRILQRAVGVAEDGQWGRVSQGALNALDPNDALFRFLGRRGKFMVKLQKFDTYGRGWSDRIFTNLLYAAEDN